MYVLYRVYLKYDGGFLLHLCHVEYILNVPVAVSTDLSFTGLSYDLIYFSFPFDSEFRQFTIEIIRESFLHLPQPPANLTAVRLKIARMACY